MKPHNLFRWLCSLLITSALLMLFVLAFGRSTFAQAMPAVTPPPADAPPPDFAEAEPLPGGCKDTLPPGGDEPVCCLSGVVEKEGVAVLGAVISIRDAQGEIGKVYTRPSPRPNQPPKYYVDLSKLKLRLPGQTRPITPTDVITLVASYSGVVGQPVRYVVQPGGQNLDFNPYDVNVLPLVASNTGFATPGTFQSVSASAIYSDSHLLYLWDVSNNRMQALRLDGTREWLDLPNWQREFGSQPEQFLNVSSIALDQKSGRIYVADNNNGGFNHGIKVYSADGDFTGQVIPMTRTIVSLGIDNAGYLYSSSHEGLTKYDANGNFVREIPLEPGKAGQRITVAPSGDIYMFTDSPNGIFKYDSNLQPVLSFTLHLTPSQTISRPLAVTLDDQNNLYVYDITKLTIQAFDPNGNPLNRTWSSSLGAAGAISLFYHQGYLYLISGYGGRIMQLSTQGGGVLANWGGASNNAGNIEIPSDIVIAPDGSLFVADFWTGRISKIVNNVITESWDMGEIRKHPGIFPHALTFDQKGRLLVTTNGHDIQRFRYDADMSTLVTDTIPLGEYGTDLGKFSAPSGVAVDKDGFVYITELGNHRIQVWQPTPGDPGVAALTSISMTGILSLPFGIVVNDAVTPKMVYVSDHLYQHIAKFSFDGVQLKFVGTIGSYGTAPGQFVTPNRLTIDDQKFLWVADSYDRVHRIDPNDPNPKQPEKWRIYGNPLDPAWHAYGIAITKTVEQQPLLYVSSYPFGMISSFTPMSESHPIATIVNLSEADLEPGDTLTVVGSGQDGDASNQIANYEWTFTNANATSSVLTLSTTNPQVTLPVVAGASQPDKLGAGLYTMRLRVQDTEGTWSEPVSRTIYVAPQAVATPATPIPNPNPSQPPPPPPANCLAGGKWTLLLYLDADNSKDGQQLLENFNRSLNNLKTLNHPCVQVAVQIDGHPVAGRAETVRWLLRPNVSAAGPMTITEQLMDTTQALQEFLLWGQGQLPADHYYLAIADHGNAYQGIAFDHSSPNGEGWNAYLKMSDLRAALTTPGVLPIDVLHLDACSMALLDVAYELRGQVKYLIASQYIAWSLFAYEDYARYLTEQSDAKQLAKLIVDRYANQAEQYGLPYTLSVLDLSRIGPVKTGIDQLAMFLKAWLRTDSVTGERHQQFFAAPGSDGKFHDLRNQSQFFDSNSNYLNTPRDAYIDLFEFVERVKQANLTKDISLAAHNVLTELRRDDSLILHERHSANGQLPKKYSCKPGEVANSSCQPKPIDLQRAHGVSLYYPAEGDSLLLLPVDQGTVAQETVSAADVAASTDLTYTLTYSRYVSNQLFDFTFDARWDEFLLAAYGLPPVGVALAESPAPLAPLDLFSDLSSFIQWGQTYRNTNGQAAIVDGDVVQFTTTITNNTGLTLTNVAVELDFGPIGAMNAALESICEGTNGAPICRGQVGQIQPDKVHVEPIQVTVTASMLTNGSFTPRARLLVNDQQVGTTIIPTGRLLPPSTIQVYLPLVTK